MYGMVHLGMSTMVSDQHGAGTWQEVIAAAGYPDLVSISNESYPDEVTFALVAAACEVLGVEQDDLLRAFGRYWIDEFASQRYETLLDASGDDVPSFLSGLNNLHVRIGLIFPDYEPPRFDVSGQEDRSLMLNYVSRRDGLAPFVMGLLEGIGSRFEVEVDVRQIAKKGEDSDGDLFAISW